MPELRQAKSLNFYRSIVNEMGVMDINQAVFWTIVANGH